MKKNSRPRKRFTSDTVFDLANRIFMIFIFLIFAWPLWFVMIASFSDPNAVNAGKVIFFPVDAHLEGYKMVFTNKDIWMGYINSIFYTVVGTAVNMIMTIFAAYPLSRMEFMPRKFFTVMFLITMYFGGGMIPTFLQVKALGLVDSRLAMIIPGAVSIFNVLLLRSFFMYGVPKSIEEAAMLDGANPYQLLIRIYLPLVKPTLAVLVLYYAVGHWNDYYSALIYMNNRDYFPLQSILREILISDKIDLEAGALNAQSAMERMKIAGTMKYSVIIVSTLPLMLIYPFIQKHFVKGIMIGAVKG